MEANELDDLQNFKDPGIQRQWINFRKSLRPFELIPSFLFTSILIPTFFVTCLFLKLDANGHSSDSFYRLQMFFGLFALVRLLPQWILTYLIYYKYEGKSNKVVQDISCMIGLSGIKDYLSVGGIVIITSIVGVSGMFILQSTGVQYTGIERNNLCSSVAPQRVLSFDLYGVLLMQPALLQAFHKGTCWAVIFISWLIMSASIFISLYLIGERDIYNYFNHILIVGMILSLLRSHESLLEKCFVMKLQQEKLIRSSLKTENENTLMDMQANEIR